MTATGTGQLPAVRRRRRHRTLVGACIGLLTACVASACAVPPTPAQVLARMSEAQRVGQLFMVGSPATGTNLAVVGDVVNYHVGSVFLAGRSTAGVTATRSGNDKLQGLATPAATSSVPLLIATDQEGGYVQVLSGPGFSTMPTALFQGTETVATNRAQAQTWGGQLAAAGVKLNLAPVLDVVPPGTAASNPPVGAFQREYGYYTGTVAGHGAAVIQGMQAAGVGTSGKHFPGLGRVTGNTDVTSGVTDTVTSRNDPYYVIPYRAAVAAGLPVVMISTAYYSRIDPARRAAFSPTVIQTLLRGDLQFTGVVISDDLANARQVADLTPAARAVDFLAAGGDLVLTVDPYTIQQMVPAVLARANTDSAFRTHIDQAVLRILQLKQSLGLQAAS
jgi:beta-N-acetylhexosaminidase